MMIDLFIIDLELLIVDVFGGIEKVVVEIG